MRYLLFLVAMVYLTLPALAQDPAQVVLPDEQTIQLQIDRMVDETAEITEKDHKAAIKLIEKGVKLHDRGKFQSAAKQYKKALEKNPLFSAAYYELAITQYALRDLEECFANSVRAIAIDPRYEEAYIMKASALDDSGYPERALQEYDRLITINPQSFMAWLNKGVTHIGNEQHEEAEAAMQAAIEIDATHPSPYYFLMYSSGVRGYTYDETKYGEQFLQHGQQDPRRPVVEERLDQLSSISIDSSSISSPFSLLISILRGSWVTSKHHLAYPEERGYRPSLKEESDVVSTMVKLMEEGKLEIGEADKKAIAELAELKSLGLIDARNFVLLKDHLGPTDLMWGEEHDEEIQSFIAWQQENGADVTD